MSPWACAAPRRSTSDPGPGASNELDVQGEGQEQEREGDVSRGLSASPLPLTAAPSRPWISSQAPELTRGIHQHLGVTNAQAIRTTTKR
jgi:hypothetical protein